MSNLLRRRQMMGDQGGPQYIQFVDPNVEAICVTNWSSDGIGLTYRDAAAVRYLSGKFTGNSNITSFNEFQYFTGIEYLYYNDFTSCPNLTEITLPDSPNIYIRDGRALGTGGEIIVNIPSMNYYYDLLSRSNGNYFAGYGNTWYDYHIEGERVEIVSIPLGNLYPGMFCKWKYIKDITVADGETIIPSGFCASVYNLEVINLPSSITEIQTYAFSGANATSRILQNNELNLPNLNTIGVAAFFQCYLFSDYKDLGVITNIPSQCFLYCTNITIRIPATVTTITGDRSIQTYSSTYYIYPATPPSYQASSLGSVVAIYIPAASLATYQTTSPWSNYASLMQGI